MTGIGVILQTFSWYAARGLWADLTAQAPALARAGITAVWLPPSTKGSYGADSVGYAVYDLFDLGEFDQKQSVPTKYGTRAELLAAIAALQAAGVQAYADVVFNHKDGGDALETASAQRVSWDDRNQAISDWYDISIWTCFTFPGRAGKYSTMQWHWWCFDAVSYDANHIDDGEKYLFRLRDKNFSTAVSHEHGNYDYLIANDLDMDEPFVVGELRWWGEWFLQTTRVDGWRIDACKHIPSWFFPAWLGHLRGLFQQQLFAVGEYWSADVADLHGFISDSGGCMSLFDAPLHYRLRAASVAGAAYDLRTIFAHTLVAEQPALAVTFVDNHDTQPCQSLESWVEPWFKPLAYALILLRRDGYPCVFAGDYSATDTTYNDKDRDVTLYSHRFLIDIFLAARRDYAYGDQHDSFDHPNCIGWLRTGDAAHPGALAVVMSNAAAGWKWMATFRPGARFRDATGHIADTVTANGDGWACFPCPGGSVSVWLQQ